MASATLIQDKTDLSLEFTRVIRAPRPRVFDAWTRPEMIRMWFGPPNRNTTLVETDPVVDGKYVIGMDARPEVAPLPPARVEGTYTKVQPYDLLQFTWDASWTTGETSLVTIYLRDVEGGTELKLVHDRFATEQSRDGHQNGWAPALDKMVQLLEG